MRYYVVGKMKRAQDDAPKVFWATGPLKDKATAEYALIHAKETGSPLLAYSITKTRRKFS